jgi:hypothetical protein
MQYFRKYLNGGTSEEEPSITSSNHQKAPFVYIKKWVKT